MNLRASIAVGFVAIVLTACGGQPPAQAPTSAERAPTAPREAAPEAAAGCPGAIAASKELSEISDASVLASALGKPGEGKLCRAKVFQVSADVRVYRVWDGSKPTSRLGRWWSLTEPKGPVDEYRKANAICKAWSALDRVVACKLKVGAKVVVGSGQSAKCDDGVEYGASPVNQLFVPDGAASLSDCTEGASFP